MRDGRLSTKLWVAGLLGIGLGACGNATTGNGGSGGLTSTTGGSGGTTTVVTGTGGATGSGGTTSQPGTGGKNGTGGTTATGGAQETGGTVGTGGRTTGTGGRTTGTGGSAGSSTAATGGIPGAGGTGNGGLSTGSGGAAGGTVGTGGRATGGTAGGVGTGGATGRGGSTGTNPGTCTASKTANVNVSGTGTHKVVVESNSGADIACGTIYRPADLGGTEKYPIFVWGEGACSRSGTSNQAAMGEIASHGYFVVADGPTGNTGASCPSISMPSSAADLPNMAKPLLGYIAWAIAENDKPCSAYYQSLDPTKVASDGFSCGGLMSEGTASDSRMTTWGITSSGLTSPDQNFYKKIHTPVKILLGGTSDMAYTNGERDYDNISALGIPIVLFSKNLGHGGDLTSKPNGGDFTKVNLAWLNWQLKGDVSATGKGFLVGDTCTFCKDTAWEVKSKNLP